MLGTISRVVREADRIGESWFGVDFGLFIGYPCLLIQEVKCNLFGVNELKRYISIVGLSLFLFSCSYSAFCATGEDSTTTTLQVSRYFDHPLKPELYLMRPGDQLQISFIGASVEPLNLMVDSEGRLVQQFLGVVETSGRILQDVKAELQERLQAIYKVDQIVITLSNPMQVAVSIFGQVSRPGVYLGSAWQTVAEMIDSAGGVLPSGSKRRIMFTGGARDFVIDLQENSDKNELLSNPPIYMGRKIFVPQARTERVLVVGAVNQPGSFELIEGDSIDDLIGLAGGFIEPDGKDRVEILRGGKRLPAKTTVPENGDIIHILRAENQRGEMLSIFGAVHKSGYYSLESNRTLKELLTTVGGVTDDANMFRVALYRRPALDDWQESGTERFLVHLFTRDSDLEAVKLSAGDSLFIPFMKGYVRFDGDIVRPGLYPFVEGQTIAFYIDAGGFGNYEKTDLSFILTHPATGLRESAHLETIVQDGDQIIVRYEGADQ